MTDRYYYKDCPDMEMLAYLESLKVFDEYKDKSVDNFDYYEFNLPELFETDSSELLRDINQLELAVGLEGWKSGARESGSYRGFSLTYNKDYVNKDTSPYHQTFGDLRLSTSYSRAANKEIGKIGSKKNSYYDTYGFRNVHPIIRGHFGNMFDKINGVILRSRVAYIYSDGYEYPNKEHGWHVDEKQYSMLRLVIPVKTCDNYFLEIDGSDEFGNTMSETTYPKINKAYIWNNRIPHRVSAHRQAPESDPRIHIIIGFSPWLSYNSEGDFLYPNKNFGVPLHKIISEKRFINT